MVYIVFDLLEHKDYRVPESDMSTFISSTIALNWDGFSIQLKNKIISLMSNELGIVIGCVYEDND